MLNAFLGKQSMKEGSLFRKGRNLMLPADAMTGGNLVDKEPLQVTKSNSISNRSNHGISSYRTERPAPKTTCVKKR